MSPPCSLRPSPMLMPSKQCTPASSSLMLISKDECGHLSGTRVSVILMISECAINDDNDTLRKVPHLSNEGLALQARV